jgi:AP-3 complex subunit delta-1
MLIKVIKLLGSLVGEEPRLARKLLEPLATLIQTSPAKSVQYEAIHCVTLALQHTKKADGSDAKNVPTVVRLCTDRLRELVRDPDQNLKYLGLVGLVGLMKSAPRVVAEHRELVLACLMDEDVTIRLRALELVCGMCTRRNLGDIVESLLGQVEGAEGHWRTELIDKIIFMCSRDKYAYLSDFAWYVEVLARLAKTRDFFWSLHVPLRIRT